MTKSSNRNAQKSLKICTIIAQFRLKNTDFNKKHALVYKLRVLRKPIVSSFRGYPLARIQ